MDQSNQVPTFEIPKSPEKLSSSGTVELLDSEISNETYEILPKPVGVGRPISVAPSVAPSIVNQQGLSAPTSLVVPLADDHIVADDVDVIEKEWVERAKKIISMTSSDPFVEAMEIGKLKAAYVKKRFKKDLPAVSGDTK